MTRLWIQSNTSSVSPQRLFAVLCGHSPTQHMDMCCRVGVNMGRVAVKVNSPLLLELETEKAQSSLTKDPGTPVSVAEHCSQGSLVEDEVMRSTTPKCDPGKPEHQETLQPEDVECPTKSFLVPNISTGLPSLWNPTSQRIPRASQ